MSKGGNPVCVISISLSLSLSLYLTFSIADCLFTFVCTYTSIHACMHTYIYMHMYVCIYICLYICMCIYIYICIYTCSGKNCGIACCKRQIQACGIVLPMPPSVIAAGAGEVIVQRLLQRTVHNEWLQEATTSLEELGASDPTVPCT